MNRRLVPSLGVFWLRIFLPQATSLKDRRRIVRSLIDKTRRQNVSVADVGPLGSHTEACLLFAVAGSSIESASRFIDSLERQICRLEEQAFFEIRESRREVEVYGDFSD
ncbi:DUF503 domain-containing protein [Aminithiophilus ramosus]|uniref:DUF503 domain-containing protein n=2 Tax=Synergistales TaxID=649776 RepID=A0A9Q7A4B6_9BACT|nr:DUF503 domain-containing protein [Aminithiophilus ramosus]QTX31200.1 DUF503 domain-containing protein [Aminithiophilus ramosus]QVL37478.1 DUF503 domain-containing protein [Synergistota bacterium]